MTDPKDMPTPEWPDGPNDLPPSEPWDVKCARCGHEVSTDHAVAEEGDEWECEPCNNAWNKIEKLERRLAVQTALAESLAAKAQFLRLLVERAVEALRKYGKHHYDCGHKSTFPGKCTCGLDAFLSEIRERK